MNRFPVLASVVLLAGALATAPAAWAQTPPETPRPHWLVDAAAGRIIYAPGTKFDEGPVYHRTQLSTAGWRQWSISPRGRLRLSAGARLTHGWSAIVALRRQGSPDKSTSAYLSDSTRWLYVRGLRLTALNLAAGAQWRPVRWLRVGLNIDLAGVPLYSRGRGWVDRPLSVADTLLPSFFGTRQSPAPDARAQRGNLLLGGQRDRGFLNSEFYLGFDLHRGLDVRFGLSHIVTNYVAEGRRYQTFQNLGFVGLTYELPPRKN